MSDIDRFRFGNYDVTLLHLRTSGSPLAESFDPRHFKLSSDETVIRNYRSDVEISRELTTLNTI